MVTSLIATVGGTVEPLIITIAAHKPQYMVFLCSNDSVEKVPEIKAAVLAAGFAIPFTDHKVLVDDINDLIHCYQKARQCIRKLEEWGVAADETIVDITGGTKIMSAALALATVKHGHMFSYIGGYERTRGGIGEVISGQEIVREGMNPWSLFAIEESRHIAEFFNLYQFSAAEQVTAQLLAKPVIDNRLRQLLEIVKALCIGYSAWDRFVHKEAVENIKKAVAQLDTYVQVSGEARYAGFLADLRGNLEWLQQLRRDTEGFRNPARLQVADLVANAERRAQEGKYDDAVARLYRALELDGQVALTEPPLFIKNASDVPAEKIPESLREEFINKYSDENGKIKLGLRALFTLLAAVGHSRGIAFMEQWKRINGILSARNQSILAHGSQPIAEDTYTKLKAILCDNLTLTETVSFPKMPIQ